MIRPRLIPSLIAVLALWLGIIAFAGYLMLSIEIKQTKATFDEKVGDFVGDVRHKLDTNEAVLAGFASFLQAVDRNDTVATARYASSIVSAYPHIYMLEVARKLKIEDQSDFEAALRKDWRADFSIKDFPALKGVKGKVERQKNFVWPIVFMYPSLPDAQAIYGVRLETVDYLLNSLALAKGSARAVATPVFNMYEGGNAYILLREVIRPPDAVRPGLDIFGSTMVALLLIKTDAMWPNSAALTTTNTSIQGFLTPDGTSNHILFNQQAGESGWLDRLLLPIFSREIRLESLSQPTVLKFNHQLQWSELLHWQEILLLLMLSGLMYLVSWLTLRHYIQIDRSAIEHERSVYLATHDLLTNLPNRFLFKDRFEQVVQQSRRNGNRFALLLLDLDHFKEINDRYGHQVGDEVLVECSRRMVLELRTSDTVARHGGDEFIILLGNVLDTDDACIVAEKILASMTTPIETSAGLVDVSCSIGVAMYPEQGEVLDLLRAHADEAMYLSKQRGRNMVSVHT